MSVGIYIHVPFCLRKCPYCDFYSVEYDDITVQKYVYAVCRNIEKYKDMGVKVDTVYFGGGTPSLLTPEQVGMILNCISDNFITVSPEITLEANPCSVNFDKLAGYRNAGVNRISLGVQSADNGQLEFLGRLHNFDLATKAVYDAQSAGFDNISCDIMLGLAGQDMESLCDTVDRITALPVSHISAYMLKIEKGTPFDKNNAGRLIAEEDMQCDMYLKTVERLAEKGFLQYEVSNFASDEKYSRHNLKYWQGKEYIGFGPSAHSYFGGKRFYVPKDLPEFINSPFQIELLSEESPDKFEEYVIFSTRLKWGIAYDKLSELGGKEVADYIQNKAIVFEKQGLCKVRDGNISLTPKGFLVSNAIIGEFMDYH